MSYFDFIHDLEDAWTWREEEMDLAWTWREEEMDLAWSEKENPLFEKEQCDIWEGYANALLKIVKNFKETIGD